ncbi:hypothetical protein SAMN05216275_1418 [Streptosporangium canum]|uniref:Uncharacterized protein n=1 Tax=Streptosporangium canum TaxID=324952 RepID=A0A1I4DHY1_9ACTN|nr:hypothetical protein [Streptosporangium canum]SFK91501.1 hypothetical protein SAMN05216275_1418 [Streptosporangium canum]
MSDSPITVRLPRNMLDLLVPEGSTLALAWVVLVGDRAQITTTPDGRPVYGAVTSWNPILPLRDQFEATTFAERLGEASIGGVCADQWLWYPVSGECPALVELYGVVDDDQVQTEVAIAPLTALLADAPEQAPAVEA